MAGSNTGTIFQITTWGESHGKGVGVVVDGCPSGLPLSEEDIQIYLNRRNQGSPNIQPHGPKQTGLKFFLVSLKDIPQEHRFP